MIPLEGLTHHEVPYNRVAEHRAFLREHGKGGTLVIPMEFGEEYCKNFTFSELVTGFPLIKR